MSIASYASLLAKQATPTRSLHVSVNNTSPLLGASMWAIMTQGGVGASPGAAAVPTAETVGSPGRNLGLSSLGAAHIVKVRGRAGTSSGENVSIYIVDRLSHQSGLSGNTGTTQTTNLPTAAIPARDEDTTGTGVHAIAEIYTAIGAGGPFTAQVSYTNQAGVAARTSPAQNVGGTSWNTKSTAIWLPFQTGDSGVRSVESATLSATTGTVGDWGITLVRPLLQLTAFEPSFDWCPVLDGGGLVPTFPNNACLGVYVHSSATGLGVNLSLDLQIDIAED